METGNHLFGRAVPHVFRRGPVVGQRTGRRWWRGGGGGGGDIPDYGDLIILYRDANGVPIPSEATRVLDPETGETVDGGLCWQPIAFEPNTCGPEAIPFDSDSGKYLVPVDQYTCGVEAEYAACTQEADFGRMNDARAPDGVFESQLADAVVNLATADCITLDPAGRMVHSRVDDDIVVSKTIDSPLQNLAIYRQLMLTGDIGVTLPAGAKDLDILDTAARALGAASDKTGELNLDMVAYLNQIMGLTDRLTSTKLPKRFETYREEVQGEIQLVEKGFLDYGTYSYNRTNNFGALPAPPYVGGKTDEVQHLFFNDAVGGTFTLSIYGYVTDSIIFPAKAEDVETALEGIIPNVAVTGAGEEGDPWVITFLDPGGTDVPEIMASDDELVAAEEGVEVSTIISTFTEGAAGDAGMFEYSYKIDDVPTFGIMEGPITTAVFKDQPGFTEGNIGGFAQAADDTRAVIDFMHTNPVSLDFVSPVACYVCPPPSGQDPPIGAYDVSISEESGLQVPRQMVDGSEGREFIVTVANASGSADPASGTVTVTATAENYVDIDGSPWKFEFTDLAVGASKSWTTFFTIDLGERTTIAWTATAAAPDDVNSANNTVTATTGVKVTGGGRR